MSNHKILELATKVSRLNKKLLEASSFCKCFFCFSEYEARHIKCWIDKGETAICPNCGVDSVIGSISKFPMSEEFFKKLHSFWFGSRYN